MRTQTSIVVNNNAYGQARSHKTQNAFQQSVQIGGSRFHLFDFCLGFVDCTLYFAY